MQGSKFNCDIVGFFLLKFFNFFCQTEPCLYPSTYVCLEIKCVSSSRGFLIFSSFTKQVKHTSKKNKTCINT
jgi:hypothetical protein